MAALVVVVLLFVALASFIAVKTPAWENADELGHVQNIETLVRGHWYGIVIPCKALPVNSPLVPAGTPLCQGNEAHQPPLYYLLMAGWQDVVGLPAQNPPDDLGVGPGIFGGEHFTSHPDQGFILWLRFPNILLGAATVVMAFLAARLVARDRWTPVIAAAIVAFLPRFVFLSASVTNDNFVNLLGAILTICALRFTRRASFTWMIASGAVFGLLVTTKLSVLPLGFLLPVLALSAPTWRRRLSLLLCGVASALVVSSWYLIQNSVRYGDPLARHASEKYLVLVGGLGTPFWTPYVVRDPLHLVFIDVPKRLVTTYWYEGGWEQFHWPTWVGIVITLIVIGTLFGLIGQGISRRVLLTLGTISVLSLGCLWFVAFQTETYQSRLALVGLPAAGTLVALALRRWPVLLRCSFPIAGVVGCLLAIHRYVVGIHWT